MHLEKVFRISRAYGHLGHMDIWCCFSAANVQLRPVGHATGPPRRARRAPRLMPTLTEGQRLGCMEGVNLHLGCQIHRLQKNTLK